jgi:hypothetical protein
MQDAVLIYYMIANLLHAGYFADIAKAIRGMATQLRTVVTGSPNVRGASPVAAGTRAQASGLVPAAWQEFEDWVERLTRMESYVLSMR